MANNILGKNEATVAVRHEAESAAALFPPMLLEAERMAQAVSAGLHGRRRAGPGETFWQHRPYAFGDPVSMIDWRQSARAADRLYVRQNEWEAAAAAYLWRDPSHSLDYSSQKALPTKRYRADTLLAALTVFFVVMGCFLDGISVVVLTASVVMPMVQAAGIDPLWFGIFLVVVVEMSQITPPVGFNLFVLQSLTGRDILSVAVAALPFFVLMAVALVIIVIFPGIVTYLPGRM